MSVPSVEPQPPELPAALLEPAPVITGGAVLWALATLAAFFVPALESWRPITVSGLGVGLWAHRSSCGNEARPAADPAAHRPALSRTDIHTDTPEEAPMVAPLLQAEVEINAPVSKVWP